jgi:hypothetical protein
MQQHHLVRFNNDEETSSYLVNQSFDLNLSARIITVVMETGDLNLISAYSMSVFLNLAVIFTASIYSNSSNTKEKKLN